MEIELRSTEDGEPPPSSHRKTAGAGVVTTRHSQEVQPDENAVQISFPFYTGNSTVVRRPKRIINKFPISPRSEAFRRARDQAARLVLDTAARWDHGHA